MPQITIEYSANLAEALDARTLALAIHDHVVETVDTELISCKTRLVEHSRTVIADGADDHAMLHIDLRILSGRPPEDKKALSEKVHASACAAVGRTEGLRVQVTAEVRDLDRDAYQKRRL